MGSFNQNDTIVQDWVTAAQDNARALTAGRDAIIHETNLVDIESTSLESNVQDSGIALTGTDLTLNILDDGAIENALAFARMAMEQSTALVADVMDFGSDVIDYSADRETEAFSRVASAYETAQQKAPVPNSMIVLGLSGLVLVAVIYVMRGRRAK